MGTKSRMRYLWIWYVYSEIIDKWLVPLNFSIHTIGIFCRIDVTAFVFLVLQRNIQAENTLRTYKRQLFSRFPLSHQYWLSVANHLSFPFAEPTAPTTLPSVPTSVSLPPVTIPPTMNPSVVAQPGAQVSPAVAGGITGVLILLVLGAVIGGTYRWLRSGRWIKYQASSSTIFSQQFSTGKLWTSDLRWPTATTTGVDE